MLKERIHNIDRRTVLKWLISTLAAGATIARGYLLTPQLAHHQRPPFFTHQEGHKSFLKHVVFHNPVVKQAFSISFANFLALRDQPATFASQFKEHVAIAGETLSAIFPEFDRLSPLEQDFHQTSIAMYSFAAAISPYISPEELHSHFGINIPSDIEQVGPIHEFSLFYALPRFPRVLPVDSNLCFDDWMDQQARCTGQDVIMARRLSEIAGFGWEAKETIVDLRSLNSDAPDSDIPTGLSDSLVKYDYQANRLGAISAINGYDAFQHRQPPSPVIY